MSNVTAARPYARAAFGYARECNALDAFSGMLETAAALVESPRLRTLLADPRLSRARRAEMLETIGGDRFDEPMRQLLRVLGERDRLPILPEVREQFEELRAEHEQRLTAEVVSARELDPTQQERIRAALAERTGQTVELVSKIDEQLLGGAVVRAGDRVLDASLQRRLQQLAQSLA